MKDLIVGLLAILIGGAFCFQGYLAMRIVIPIWGALAGFALGAGLVSAFNDEGFLSTLLGWAVGIGLALLFGFIAFIYYEIAVVIAMAAIGFTLGASLMVALNIDWSWAITLTGIAVAIVFAIIAIAVNMPAILLVVLSSIAGALAATGGLMILVGAINSGDFNKDTIVSMVDDDWYWYAIALAAAIAGIVTQARNLSSMRATAHEAWVESGGKTMTPA